MLAALVQVPPAQLGRTSLADLYASSFEQFKTLVPSLLDSSLQVSLLELLSSISSRPVCRSAYPLLAGSLSPLAHASLTREQGSELTKAALREDVPGRLISLLLREHDQPLELLGQLVEAQASLVASVRDGAASPPSTFPALTISSIHLFYRASFLELCRLFSLQRLHGKAGEQADLDQTLPVLLKLAQTFAQLIALTRIGYAKLVLHAVRFGSDYYKSTSIPLSMSTLHHLK